MTGPHKAKEVVLVGWGWTETCLLLGYSGLNWWFPFAAVFQCYCLTPYGSLSVTISRLSLSRLRLSRITAYLEEKI